MSSDTNPGVVLPPTSANTTQAAIKARDVFRNEPHTARLYVYATTRVAGRGPDRRTVVDVHHDMGGSYGGFVCVLDRIRGGKARDYHDRIVGETCRVNSPRYGRVSCDVCSTKKNRGIVA